MQRCKCDGAEDCEFGGETAEEGGGADPVVGSLSQVPRERSGEVVAQPLGGPLRGEGRHVAHPQVPRGALHAQGSSGRVVIAKGAGKG